MEKHPIGELMDTTISKIHEMADTNTVVGQPITTPDGTTLIPVSRISLGFVSGGTEFSAKTENAANPFGGGSGAGVKIEPIAFLVERDGHVSLLSANPDRGTPVEKLLDAIPGVVDKIREYFPGKESPAQEE